MSVGEQIRRARAKEDLVRRILVAIEHLEKRETTPLWGGVFAVDVARYVGIEPRSMGGILAGLHNDGLIGVTKNVEARCNVYYLRASGHQQIAASRDRAST